MRPAKISNVDRFMEETSFWSQPDSTPRQHDLQGRLWPADIVVDFDRGLNKAINRLREALGDDADNPQFVETLPQRGYRFIAEVETSPIPAAVPHTMPRRGWLAGAGGLAAAA